MKYTETIDGITTELRCGRWQDVLADVVECDAVICDPPYGEKTHKGHDASASGHAGAGNDGADRKALDYAHWTPHDVHQFIHYWAPLCRGWMVGMTSHDLGMHWQTAYRHADRYEFPPQPFVSPGSRCRMSGDGPSSWTAWIMVARPRTREFSTWGTLPGYYKGPSRKLEMTGAKPLWLMRAIIRDYTRPGDLIVDPFAGSGTTLIAARAEGRSCIGAECDADTFEKAVRRIETPFTKELF